MRFYQLLYKKYNIHYQDVIKSLKSSYIFDQQKLDSLQKALLAEGLLPKSSHNPGFFEPLSRPHSFFQKKRKPLKIFIIKDTLWPAFRPCTVSIENPSLTPLAFISGYNVWPTSCWNNVSSIPSISSFITKTTLVKIDRYLRLFIKALQLEGISPQNGLNQRLNIFRKPSRSNASALINILISSCPFPGVSRTSSALLHRPSSGHPPGGNPGTSGQAARAIKWPACPGRKRKQQSICRPRIFCAQLLPLGFGLQTLDNFISNILKTLCWTREIQSSQPHVEYPDELQSRDNHHASL